MHLMGIQGGSWGSIMLMRRLRHGTRLCSSGKPTSTMPASPVVMTCEKAVGVKTFLRVRVSGTYQVLGHGTSNDKRRRRPASVLRRWAIIRMIRHVPQERAKRWDGGFLARSFRQTSGDWGSEWWCLLLWCLTQLNSEIRWADINH